MEKLIRPSDPELVISIQSGQNSNIITIPCFLHTNDSDALYDVLFSHLKQCTKTESFIDEINAEAEEYEPFKNLFAYIDDLTAKADVRLEKMFSHFRALLNLQDLDLEHGTNYRKIFYDNLLYEIDAM